MIISTWPQAIEKKLTPFSLLAFFFIILVLAFSPALASLTIYWLNSEEFGHGLLLSGLAVFTFIQRREYLSRLQIQPAASGYLILLFSFLLYTASILADIELAKYYAFFISLSGVTYALGGFVLLRPLLFPLSLVALSFPFPYLVTRLLTQELQLISSDIGVYFIRLMGLPVLQNGNVIDMGSFVMLVEEACSGLRYLLPLMAIGWVAAYSYRGGYVTRLLIFIVTIPITVLMNSARIAVTGLLIKYAGSEAAQGFIHDFEGWVVFLCACIFLYGVIEVITRVTKGRLGATKHFTLHHTHQPEVGIELLPLRRAYALLLVLIVAMFSLIYSATLMRESDPINRKTFDRFPLRVGSMEYFPDLIAPEVLRVLKADDYFLGDFIGGMHPPVNLYMAYYKRQREGSVIHSPKDCLPSAGWEIQKQQVVDLADYGMKGKAVRAIIEQGGEQLLVLYWVNQQNINYANELAARAALLYRALVYGRTDGTLVRVYTAIEHGEQEAEQRLVKFVSQLNGVLPVFLPQ